MGGVSLSRGGRRRCRRRVVEFVLIDIGHGSIKRWDIATRVRRDSVSFLVEKGVGRMKRCDRGDRPFRSRLGHLLFC